MAALSSNARSAVCREYAEEISRVHEGIGGISKHELRAAIDAIDTWADANQTAFNAAIPQPARGAMNASQKARLLALVVTRRHRDGA